MRLMCTFYQKLAISSELCWGSMISPIIHLALLKQNVATVDQVFLEASGFNQILPALEGTIIFVHYIVKVHLHLWSTYSVLLDAGKIFRPERCSLSDKNFETLMMIKCNSEIRTLIMKK